MFPALTITIITSIILASYEPLSLPLLTANLNPVSKGTSGPAPDEGQNCNHEITVCTPVLFTIEYLVLVRPTLPTHNKMVHIMLS